MKPVLLVLGATGLAGRGVVAAAVAAGRPVVAVARRMDELLQLRAAHAAADLTILCGSVADEARSARLVKALRRLGRPLAGIVTSICNDCGRGRVLEQPVAALRAALDQNLLAHAAAARHLLPLLAQGGRAGRYVLIGGPDGEQPWAGYGHRAIVSASLRMLARVLHEEARSLAVRVQLLAVESPLRDGTNPAHAGETWPTAEAVGQRALQLIDQDDATPARAIVRYAAATADTVPPSALRSARRFLDSLVPLPG